MAYLEEVLSAFRTGTLIRKATWKPEQYIYLDKHNGFTYLNTGELFCFNSEHFLDKDWEPYTQTDDYEIIIKNKCPCWFWDNDFKGRALGLLVKIDQDNTKFPYGRDHNDWWQHCCPVNQDELTFFSEIVK